MMPIKYLNIGGLVAMGFDPSGRYLLTVSHSGRGVYDMQTWNRIARDLQLAYPEGELVDGIGPLDGQKIPVEELNYKTGILEVITPDKNCLLH